MSAVEEAKDSAEAADVSELLAQQEQQPEQQQGQPVSLQPAVDEQVPDAPLMYESQTIDINGVRHEIINQGQDETGQPVVVLKNEETGDHIVLPLSALVGEADASAPLPDEPLPVAEAAGDVMSATEESQTQNEAQTAEEFASGSQVDAAVLSCVTAQSAATSEVTSDQSALPAGETAVGAEAADAIVADQLHALADQAGVEQQMMQQPVQKQPEVNGINGDMTEDTVLQAAQVGDGSAVNQITFDPNAVIDGANGSSLEALVAGATVVAGEDGYVIIPSEDGSGAGQQISLADVIGDGDGTGQTYLIQTDEGLVACSGPPEIVDKVSQSPVDQIASNEQAILEAVLASGNFTNGQVIHAVAGDQTMAYTVQISNEGASLIPIGPVTTNNAPASPKKIMGKSRNQGESMMATSRAVSSPYQRSNPQSRKHQSNVSFGNSRQVPANRSLTAGSKIPESNQVTVTRINPPSRSSQPSTTSSSLTSDVSLLTGVTGPSQLSSSRRTYSKKNILWVNPDSTTKSASSSFNNTSGNEKTATVVPALVSSNSNMTVSATTVSSSPEKAVSPVAKKQNPILTARSSTKQPLPLKQQAKDSAKEEVEVVPEPEKRKELKKDVSKAEPIKKTPEKVATTQQPQKVVESPVAKKVDEKTPVSRKFETKKKEPEAKAPEPEPTRRSHRASKRITKGEEESTPAAVPGPAPEAKGPEPVPEPAPEPAPAPTVVAETTPEPYPEPEAVVTAESPASEPASQAEVPVGRVGKRGARRSVSTEKKETATPSSIPASKQTRSRSRPLRIQPEAEATIEDVCDHKEEAVVAEVASAADEPVAETVAEATPVAVASKTPARKSRKPVAEKPNSQAESNDLVAEQAPVKGATETAAVVAADISAEPDNATKGSGGVRRSGRASKRKVEEDFVSEIEPEALGERPSRKSKAGAGTPEKEVKAVKDAKVEKETEKAKKSEIQTENVGGEPAPLVNSHDTAEVEDIAVPAVAEKEKKESIAVTPKKRVGFREALDEPSPSSSAKRARSSSDDCSSLISATPRRVSSAAKLTPILKPSKETPKGRRLATPIVCEFTPYDKDEDCRRMRESISNITEKRSQADHYEISSPNLTIHVRHQSASSYTPTQTSGSYSCQKCGYNTSRINNLTLHHKNQCPVAINECMLSWQNEIKKQQIRNPAATSTPSATAGQMDKNSPSSDVESPEPTSAVADVHDNETNDTGDTAASEKPSAVIENDTTSSLPIAAKAASVPTTSIEVCPPSDDEEDGVTENATGILKSNSHLFDSI